MYIVRFKKQLRFAFHTFFVVYQKFVLCTGKSLSEALISASTNPQYDDRLFIELQVQYILIVACVNHDV